MIICHSHVAKMRVTDQLFSKRTVNSFTELLFLFTCKISQLERTVCEMWCKVVWAIIKVVVQGKWIKSAEAVILFD